MHESRASSPLPAELFAQIKTIQLRAQRLVTDMMMGEYESAFKGRGMEFEKVREYQPGDDVRHIDWNVTARMQSAYVKEYREERELTVMLVVDVSASGSFGSARKLKNEVAAEVAAVLAYTAVKSNDRVGLIIFSDRIEHYIPPKKGRAHVWRVIRDILAFKPQGRGTDVEGALDYLGRVVRRRSVSFIISDFLDSPLAERLRITARRHELTAVSVVDPREEALPPVGLLELEDAETGEVMVVDAADPQFAQAFAAQAAQDRRLLSETLRAAGVGQIVINTHAAYVEPIVRFFRQRERRRVR